MEGSKKRERTEICNTINCDNSYATSCKMCFKRFCIVCAYGLLVKIEGKLICRGHTEECLFCLNRDIIKEVSNCGICFKPLTCVQLNCGLVDGWMLCKKHSYPCNTENCKKRTINRKINGKFYCKDCYESYKTGIECLILKFKYRCNYRDMVNYTLQFIL